MLRVAAYVIDLGGGASYLKLADQGHVFRSIAYGRCLVEDWVFKTGRSSKGLDVVRRSSPFSTLRLHYAGNPSLPKRERRILKYCPAAGDIAIGSGHSGQCNRFRFARGIYSISASVGIGSSATSVVNEIVIDDGVFHINATSRVGMGTSSVSAGSQTSVSSILINADIGTALSDSPVSAVRDITIEGGTFNLSASEVADAGSGHGIALCDSRIFGPGVRTSPAVDFFKVEGSIDLKFDPLLNSQCRIPRFVSRSQRKVCVELKRSTMKGISRFLLGASDIGVRRLLPSSFHLGSLLSVLRISQSTNFQSERRTQATLSGVSFLSVSGTKFLSRRRS
jgi:hypothetical protein